MAARIDLTTPTPDRPGINNWQVVLLIKDRENRRLTIKLMADNGERFGHVYDDTHLANGTLTGFDLMIIMNKRDYTTISEEHQILQQLIDDGHIDGTVSGEAD